MARQPSVKVNGYEVGAGLTRRIVWAETEGLLEATKQTPWTSFETFQGPGRNHAGDMDYPSRRLSIVVRITKQDSFLSKHEALATLTSIFSGQPAIVQVGSLYLEAEFSPPQVQKDAWKLSAGYLTVRFEGEAIPGTFFGEYGYQQGREFGIIVQDDRSDHPSLIFTGNSITVTNPGTAPTEAVVQVTNTGLPNTTVYLKGRDGQMMPVNLDATGYGRIDEAFGFLLYPGSNAVQIVNAAGALITTGTFRTCFYGTRFRHIGNTSNRFADGQVFQHARTGPATYIAPDGTLKTAGDGVARLGVPFGPYSASKAGLMLEGAGTNLVKNSSFVTDRANWSAGTRDAQSGGSSGFALKLTYSGSTVIASSDLFPASAGTTYTLSSLHKVGSGVTCHSRIAFYNASSTLLGFSGRITTTALTFGRGSVSLVAPAGTTQARVDFFVEAGGNGDAWMTDVQVEPSPFPTSLIQTSSNATATRQPDICGIVPPHNELIHSHDLTQSAWVKSGASVAKAGTANTLTLAVTSNAITQAVTPTSIPSTTRTAAAKLRLGTITGSVRLRLLDQAGTQIASTTINTTDLSATDARTFYVTGTPGGSVSGLQIQIIGNAGTGTVIVESLRLVRGSHPGLEVMTTDTPIPAPASPALDPAWSQNGRIRFRVLTPPISTGLSYAFLGALQSGVAAGLLRFYRPSEISAASEQVRFDRAHNGVTGTGGSAGRGMLQPNVIGFWNGAPHDVILEWTNEINETTGVREMWQRLYIDGVKVAEQNVTALYGATAWAPVDPSRLISDGSVHAVLSMQPNGGGVIVEFPPRRAGYSQVDRAA